MNGTKIIHVHFNATGVDEYFGSLAAVFQVHNEREIGVVPNTLYNFGITPGKPYIGKIVTIKEGVLIRKTSNRGNPLLK